MRIFVSMPNNHVRASYMDEAVINRFKALGATFNETNMQLTVDELKEVFKTTDILVTGWGHQDITADMVKGTPLKLIVHTGGSVGALTEPALYEDGIRVLTGNDYFAESVAEGTLAYCLYAMRKMPDFSFALSKEGIWNPEDGMSTEGLLDQTVGIISLGAISKHVIRMGKAFRLKFKVFSTRRDEALAKEMGFTYADMDEIFTTCKIVSIHTAASPATRHMIDRRLLSLLKPHQVLINTSRGMVVDEDALAEMLHERRFRAVLDVFNQEPLPAGHPLINAPGAMLFPHCGGPTVDRRVYITNGLLDDIEVFMKGNAPMLPNEVSKETASRMTKNL